MIYKTSNSTDLAKLKARLKFLIEKGSVIEIKEKRQRTLKQNAYLHVIIQYFATQYGDTTEYCKRKFYKLEANKEIFLYERVNRVTGEVRQDFRSTRDLTTKELSVTIERFKDYAISKGILLPDADDFDFINEAKNQIEATKQYL